MKFLDTIIIGFYLLLNNTIYRNSKDTSFGAKEHSLLFSWAVHTLNFHTLLKFILSFFIVMHIPIAYVFIVALFLLLTLYMIYFRKGRFDKLILQQRQSKINFLIIIITILYLIGSCYVYLNYD